jgi:probable O-glycosylation ligase (exosortase A-associated)
MGLRVMATLLVTFAGITASFYNAFYGLLTYAFWSYTYPEMATWGMLPLNRLSYVTGLVLVITTFTQEKKLFAGAFRNYLMVVFWIFALLGVFTADFGGSSWWQFQFFTRVILIALIITLLVDTRVKFRYYLWAIAICVGFIAAQSGIKGTLAGQIGGASKGFEGLINDRNFMAVILCSVIPLVFYLANTERNKLFKLLLWGAFFGDILALILTYARAGFVGLVALSVFIFMKSRHKVLIAITVGMLAYVLLNYIVPDQYKQRMATITELDEDGNSRDASAQGRLIAWRSALEMIKDRPLTGVGFYRSGDHMGRYPDPVTGSALPGKAIHNSLIQVAAELGLPALVVYLMIFAGAYRSLGKIKKKVKVNGLSLELWDYASMLQISFVGFFSSGFFVNAAFINLSWHLVGLSVALGWIVDKEIREDVGPGDERDTAGYAGG